MKIVVLKTLRDHHNDMFTVRGDAGQQFLAIDLERTCLYLTSVGLLTTSTGPLDLILRADWCEIEKEL